MRRLLPPLLVVLVLTAGCLDTIQQYDGNPCNDDLVPVPKVQFAFEYDTDAETLTIRHADGPRLTFGRACPTTAVYLLVERDDEYERVWWLADNGTGQQGPPLEVGDELTIRGPNSTAEADATLQRPLGPDTRVFVVWIGPDDSERGVLDVTHLGDGDA